MKTKQSSIRNTFNIGIAGIALLIGGCASSAATTPHLTAQMAEARAAIEQAEEVEAGEHAPLALHNAQEKIEQAQRALAEGKTEKAERLAQQALVDAELAEVAARSAKAQKAARELRESIRTLREEIARKQNQ